VQNVAPPALSLAVSRPKIRVLVVDDSALIRQIIVDHISATSDLAVAAVAEDGVQAVQILERMPIDVVTLDIKMPRMDGLQTLDALLAIRPVPVLMVSSQTRLGADITLEALERGAIDYVAKPDHTRSADQAIKDELLRKIRCAADADLLRILEIRKRRGEQRQARRLAIGAVNAADLYVSSPPDTA
jgi:two-component system chemotaxis response regulator CheB